MPYGLIDYDTLKNIARAIRYKANTNRDYRPRDMAQAINTLRSGGGYEVPVLPSIGFYGLNNYDNSIIKRGSLLDFEIVNQMPENITNIIDDVKWTDISADNVVFYERYSDNYPCNYYTWDYANNKFNINVYNYSGYIYGLYVNSKWNTDKVSIIDMSGLFNGCYHMDHPFCGNLTTSLHLTYAGCQWIMNAVCGPNVVDLQGAYSYCDNLRSAACGEKVKFMAYAYNNCNNLKNGVCGNNVVDMSFTYRGCYNLTDAHIGPNVKSLYYTYETCPNLVNVSNIPSSTKTLAYAFNGCRNLQELNFDNNSQATNLCQAFGYCNNLVNINGDNIDNITSISNAFYMCNNLQKIPNLVINSQNFYYAFYECHNLTDFGITIQNFVNENKQYYYPGGETNFYLYFTFSNCTNLSQNTYESFMPDLINYVRERDNVPEYNPQNTYVTGDICKYNNQIYLYYGTDPITGEFNNDNWSYRSVYNMRCYGAFQNCKQLTKVYLSNLMDEDCIYQYCGDINEVVFDGDIKNFKQIFSYSNILQAYCPDSVINMSTTYKCCNKLTDAVCGNNVIYFLYAYDDCANLVNAACGPNVQYMSYTYRNCKNLIDAVCGDNVISMDTTYYNCTNLINAACGSNVQNMSSTYKDCHSLTMAACSDSVINAYCTYVNCYALTDAVCGNNVQNMMGMYQNCTNLLNAAIGPNVTILVNTFYNCKNLSRDTEVPSNVASLINAFNLCENLHNLYMATTASTYYSYYANSLYRTTYTTRRNVVMANRLAFNAITNYYCKALHPTAYISYTNEAYAEPVEVNVNGNTYNCVRCAYNTTYNCYIYCME